MSVKILHTADIHLGSGRTGVTGGKSEIENTFFKIIDLCLAEDIDFLLIAGDLFDSPVVSAPEVERVISAISKIPQTIVAIAPGNHDYVCPGSVYTKYKFPENTFIFTSFMEYIDFPKKGVRLWGAGFTDRFESLPLLQNSEDMENDFLNLCVLHGEVISDNSPSTYNPVYPLAIEQSKMDYIALGHIHKRSEIKKLGKTSFSYCGCPDGMGFDESGSHGVYMGTVSKNECNFRYIELSSRQYLVNTFDISEMSNSFEAADQILDLLKSQQPESFNKNLYRIILSGELSLDTSVDASQIQKILAEKLYFVEVIDKTSTSISSLSSLANETSLRGVFVSKMLDKISATEGEEQQLYKNALKIGLKAFSKGVMLGDN